MNLRALAFLLLPLTLLGQAPPRTARGMYTTGAALTRPGVLDLELGLLGRGGPGDTREGLMPGKLFLGLVPGMDLRCSWGTMARRGGEGGDPAPAFRDAWLGPQVELGSQDELGVLVSASWLRKVPVGARRAANGLEEEALLLALARVQDGWSLDGNLIVSWIQPPEGGRIPEPTATLALSRRLSERLTVTGELRGTGATALGPRNGAALVSFQWEAGPNLLLDAGVEAGMGPGAPDTVFAGLSCTLGTLF